MLMELKMEFEPFSPSLKLATLRWHKKTISIFITYYPYWANQPIVSAFTTQTALSPFSILCFRNLKAKLAWLSTFAKSSRVYNTIVAVCVESHSIDRICAKIIFEKSNKSSTKSTDQCRMSVWFASRSSANGAGRWRAGLWSCKGLKIQPNHSLAVKTL